MNVLIILLSENVQKRGREGSVLQEVHPHVTHPNISLTDEQK